MRNCAAFAALAALVLSFSAVVARAQNGSPKREDGITLIGTVRDTQGAAVAVAAVRLIGKDVRYTLEVKSGPDGTFALSISAPGTYTLWAEKNGRRSHPVSSLALAPGDKKQIELVMDSSSPSMEFDDRPNFSVAGVTDWNNTGIHASDANRRTSETLVKETLSLKPADAAGSNAGAEAKESRKSKSELREERQRVKKMLTSAETADVHRKLAELDERLGDPLEAVHEYERATQMDPSEQNYFEWGAELLLHRAAQPAVEVFTKGSRLHPGSARMQEGLGAALYASGNAEEAARKLCEAADLNPADPAAYLFLGRIETAVPAVLPCSEEKLARFAKDQPENTLANYYYGIVRWKRSRGMEQSGGVQQAEALLEKATTIDPKFGEAYLQLGIMHFAQGRLEPAIREYQKALEASPQLSEPHYRLGLAYRRVHEEAKAEQEFRVYEEMQKAETAALEKERRELRQFLIILKDQPAATPR
jgi:tetratricopeptide (TPR) repeat protein